MFLVHKSGVSISLISIDLRTVNGFGEALYNIVATVDAELSQTEKAEKVMIEHWESLRRSYSIRLLWQRPEEKPALRIG